MKKNDYIKCANQEDVRQLSQDLGSAGYHAVAGGQNSLTVTITEVPETEYLVQAWREEGTQHTYCVTLEEAEEAAAVMLEAGYEYAEICEGYPGEWERIRKITKGGEE